MNSKEKFVTVLYFAPMLLIFSAFYNTPQAPQIVGVLANDTRATQTQEITTQPHTAPAYDIQKGKHGTTDDERALIKAEAVKRWNEGEWLAFENLIQKESGWIAGNINKSSGACGLGQALPCAKYSQGAEVGDAINEANWSMDYIAKRYGTPKNALNFWLYGAPKYNGHNWY